MERQDERTEEAAEKEIIKDSKAVFSEEDTNENIENFSELNEETNTNEEMSLLTKLSAELNKAKKEAEDFKNRFYYISAETENLKKRFEREKEQLLKFGQEKILGDLVEVMDNFERVVGALKNDDTPAIKNIRLGIDMVTNQMVDSLNKHGLEQLKSLGKVFDPNFHEAMGQREVTSESDKEVLGDRVAADQVILEEFQKGYLLNGRLIRAAKVIVSK